MSEFKSAAQSCESFGSSIYIAKLTIDITSKIFISVSKLTSPKIPIILLINKIDLSSQQELEESILHWKSIFPKIDIYPISAIEGFFIDELVEIFKDELPLSPPFFPKDQLTDRPERFFVNESIREQILINYDKEIPYSVEVITEDFKESPKIIKIRSLILVERDSQKGILIGKKVQC